MRSSVTMALLLALSIFVDLEQGFAKQSDTPNHHTSSLNYSPTKTVDHIDEYHGVKIPDPYRWLEDPNSEETRKWVEAQNKVTFGYLDEISARKQIKDRLTKLWNFERYSLPHKEGDRYFYSKNDGLQN